MAIIVQRTSEVLKRLYPSLHSWVPFKEAETGITNDDLVDYAQGRIYTATSAVNLNKALSHAVQVTGTAADGDYYVDSTDEIGTNFVVGNDESFIACVCAKNMDIADSFLYYGRRTGVSTIKFTEAGTCELTPTGGSTITDSLALTSGTIVYIVGFDRSTNLFRFGGISNAPAVVTERTVSGAAYDGLPLNFDQNGSTNGISIFNGAAGANPLGVYNLVTAKFKGAYPHYINTIGPSLLAWRTDSLAGVKNIPSFLLNFS